MPSTYEIRADYDQSTIIVYQAYRYEIALPALKANKFVAPFSFNRMTWIKPSFLWLMERSNWGRKSGQEYILGVRISRDGWEEALSKAVLTSPNESVYRNHEEWSHQLDDALVLVQWDPERSLRGAKLDYYSIQVGLSRQIIKKYVDEWTIEIRDYTPKVRKMYELLHSGQVEKAKRHLPKERIYPVDEKIAKRIGMFSRR
jgi:Domain of unknown function (DUF4291)